MGGIVQTVERFEYTSKTQMVLSQMKYVMKVVF